MLSVWKTATHESLSVLGQTTISSGPGWTSTYSGTFSTEAFSRAAPPITHIWASKGKSHMLDDWLTVSHASPINMELRTVNDGRLQIAHYLGQSMTCVRMCSAFAIKRICAQMPAQSHFTAPTWHSISYPSLKPVVQCVNSGCS